MNQFCIAPKIYSNQGSIEFLKQIQGTQAFIVTDAIMDKLGYLQKAMGYMQEAGIQSYVFANVKSDPDVGVIAEGIKRFQEKQADVVVALGGGSVIDAAKGILYSKFLLAKNEGLEFPKPLFIAIPSTSGTGSEVTNFSVITANGEKQVLVDDWMTPDIAILDSTCIQHVPKQVVADTGVDAMIHAIEAYVSIGASDCSDALAEKAMQILFENLPILYKDISNAHARQRIQNASCLSGMAFTNASLGINHSLAHALGATFHLSHGRSNAMMMIAVMEYNAQLDSSQATLTGHRYAQLAKIMGLPARTYREGTVNFIESMKSLKKSLEIPSSLREMGISEAEFTAQLDNMAALALQDRCTATNPRTPTHEDLVRIYRRAF